LSSICCLPHFFYNSYRFSEKPRAFAVKPFALAVREAQVLARAAESYHVDRLYFRAVYPADVAEVFHARKPPRRYPYRKRFYFGCPYGCKSRIYSRKRETARAVE
jgi:hypothetical protein